MTLTDAIRKAEAETGGKVLSVLETPDRWIFNFDFEVNALTSVAFYCLKNNGEFGYFFPPDESELLKKATPINLPEES